MRRPGRTSRLVREAHPEVPAGELHRRMKYGVYRVEPAAGAGTPVATPTLEGATAAAGTTAGDGDVATRVVIIDRHFVTCSVSAGRSAGASETFRVAWTSNGSSTRSEGDISW